MPRVLVFAQPSPQTDDLLREIEHRADLCLLRVSTSGAARVALSEVGVDLVVVCPATDHGAFTTVLQDCRDLRPQTPVLAFVAAQPPLPDGRSWRSLALLRWPVLPEVLNRTVDVALGLMASGKE
jgi:hypothetical protein